MYRYSNGQISLSDFKQPTGMNLKEDNRWVKKAQTIPWKEIEKRYAKLFTNRKGNVAKPLQLALGACIIQAEYGFSDEETAQMIREHPYFQYFCGYAGYDDEHLPFDPSLMVYFRKRLTPEILGEINEMIVQESIKHEKQSTKSEEKSEESKESKEENDKHDDNNDSTPPSDGGNSGTMIVDATCAPSEIRFPQDVSILDEARENAEQIIDILQAQSNEKKPRTYREKAHKDSLKYMRSRKHTERKTREAIRKQLQYLRRDLSIIESMMKSGLKLPEKRKKRLDTIQRVYEQQKYMFDNQTHTVSDRIVSISQPYLRPIVRGKAAKPVEFGAKLDISVSDGWTRLECWSFDAYNEATKLKESIERYREREGHYPKRVLADKIYRNRENLRFCKERGILLSGPALGRPKKEESRDKHQDYLDQNERIEVERKFSLAKRKCNLGKVKTKLAETIGFTIAMSIVVLNLRKIQRTLLCLFLRILCNFSLMKKTGFVQ